MATDPLATALIGDFSGLPCRERNMAWRQFTDMSSPLLRTPSETAEAEAGLVAELRDALGRYPGDDAVRLLIEDLLEVSPRFAKLWERHPVARPTARRETLLHPEVGTISLDCDALKVHRFLDGERLTGR